MICLDGVYRAGWIIWRKTDLLLAECNSPMSLSSPPPSAYASSPSFGKVPGTVPSPPPLPRRPLLPPLPLLRVSRWRGHLPPLPRRDDLRRQHRLRPLPLRLPRECLLQRLHSGVRTHTVVPVCAGVLYLLFVFVSIKALKMFNNMSRVWCWKIYIQLCIKWMRT